MIGVCGMICSVCYRHLKKNNPCPGCASDEPGKPAHCRDCDISRCAGEKGLTFCFLCGEFPCSRIRNLDRRYVWRYHVSPVAFGMRAKEIGAENFLAEELPKWGCGGIVSLHDGVCSVCVEKNCRSKIFQKKKIIGTGTRLNPSPQTAAASADPPPSPPGTPAAPRTCPA